MNDTELHQLDALTLHSGSSILSKIDREADIAGDQPLPLVHRLFTWLLLDKSVPPFPLDSERKQLPLYSANWLSRGFFWWLVPLLNKGYKRTIQQPDLWYLGDDNRVGKLYPHFQENLQKLLQKHKQKHPESQEWPKNVVFWALVRTFKFQFVMAIILALTAATIQSLTPLLTKYLIQNISDRALTNDPHSVGKGVGMAIGLTLLIMAALLLTNHAFMFCAAVGSHSRTLLTKAMLERTMNGSPESRQKFPGGVVLGYMGADLERIDEGLSNSFMVVGFPISIVIGVTLLVINLKASALAGIAAFFVVCALTALPGIMMFQLRNKVNVHSDKRVALMRQIVQAMKIIKLYAWEDAYEKILGRVRAKEINIIYQIHAVLSVVFSLAFGASAMSAMTAFVVSYAVDGLGKAANVFSSLILFNILAMQIASSAFLVSRVADAMTATRRIGNFLQSPVDTRTFEDIYDQDLITDSNVAIEVKEGDFQWTLYEEEKKKKDNKKKSAGEEKADGEKKEEAESYSPPRFTRKEKQILHDINLQIYKGEFVIVTGITGSGKSSFLSALNGSMDRTSGFVGVSSPPLLCGTNWVQNTTIKENILFGEQYDSEKYKSVIYACALDHDMDSFKAGDMTQVGDRGVTLSGGQKARLNLARVVYRGADIYLLDDIISAVDAKVGKQIVDRCVLGELVGSTRVLATNNLDLLKRADRIVFLNGDGTIDIGTEDELRARNERFASLLEYQRGGEGKLQDKSKEMIEEQRDIERDGHKFNDEEGRIEVDEERAVNSIPMKTYGQFLTAASGPLLPAVLFLLVVSALLSNFCMVFSNVWLSYWLEQKFEISGDRYMAYYIMFVILGVVFVSFTLGCLGYILAKASKTLNLKAVHRVLHTPMSYTDVTPVGRIMNRFTHDTNMLDNEIGNDLKMTFFQSGLLIATVVVSIAYVPWFAIVVPIMLALLFMLTNYSQATGREVKRLEAINRSFIFSNFNEVVDGLDTIKSFGTEYRYNAKNDEMVDHLNEVRLVVLANQKWLGNSLAVLASICVTVITVLAVTGTLSLSAATVGLLVSYVFQLSDMVMDILTIWPELENQMNSVERVCHFAFELEQEDDNKATGMAPPPSWPSEGVIEMKNVVMRYRPELPVTLRSLSFRTNKFEKIGICGRTGAGKSSLMSALFRLCNLDSGSIAIDGYEISKIGLQQLRSNLSIIPQDPVLFQGTVRSNLDPFQEKSDDELWKALRRGGLIKSTDVVDVDDLSSHKFHLDAPVSGDGSNFSLGESQLISLARALVRDSKVLVMDEATSSVDFETDALIQATITREFKNCTILCIAHRLKTILHCDRIMVLEKGMLEEFDTPKRLFHKEGRFREMCDNAGVTADDF